MIRKLFKHTIYDLDKAFQEGYNPYWNDVTEYWWHRFAPVWQSFEKELKDAWREGTQIPAERIKRMIWNDMSRYDRDVLPKVYDFFVLLYYWHIIPRKACRILRGHCKRIYLDSYEKLK